MASVNRRDLSSGLARQAYQVPAAQGVTASGSQRLSVCNHSLKYACPLKASQGGGKGQAQAGFIPVASQASHPTPTVTQ